MDVELLEPTIKAMAMPEHTNPEGDLFGGWIISMMDLAGAVIARRTARKRIVTVAIDKVHFHKPVFVGDILECFVKVSKVGRTSITVQVEGRVERWLTGQVEDATSGTFTYVAVDDNRQPMPVAIDEA